MGRYLVSRIAAILWTLLVIPLPVFVLMHAIPGGPFDEDKMPLPPGDYLATGVAVLFAPACACGVSHCACEPIRARATMRMSHYARGQNAPS